MTDRDTVIAIIPHLAQRYNTCGDWREIGDNTLCIRVSDTGDARYNFLLAVHEFVEAKLCELSNITSAEIDEFDIRGEGSTLDEPGESVRAPYHSQHTIADAIERVLAQWLHVSWEEYNDTLGTLSREYAANLKARGK